MRRGGGDHQVALLGQAGHGQIGLDAAAWVQELGVDQLAVGDGDVVGANPLQLALRVGPLHQIFGERAHIEEADIVAHGAMFLAHIVEPVLPAIGVFIAQRDARRREPIGAFPADRFAEAGIVLGVARVQRAQAHRPRGLDLAVGPVHLKQQPEALARALGQVASVVLKAAEACDVELGEIDAGLALDDPLGENLAGAGGIEDALRVEAGGDKKIPQLRRLAHDELVVGGEAFRPVEELADRRALKAWNQVHRVLHRHLELIPVLRQFDELGAERQLVERQRLGVGLKAADQ